MVIYCACLGPGHCPLLVELMSRIYHSKLVGTTFSVFSYDAVFAEHRSSGTEATVPQPSIEAITILCRTDALYVMPQTRVKGWIRKEIEIPQLP